jgi:glycine/D-amino acid oxidase-like deaminating enzyme
MPRLRVNVPLWLERQSRPRRLRFPSLGGDCHVDIAVVGGGITGAAVAWRFADAGLAVAVLEGKTIGRGSSAASTALLMQEPDEDFELLARRYGRRRATRIWQLCQRATREFVDVLRRLRISCDLETRDSVYYAPTEDDAQRLRREHRMRTAAGLGGRWLGRRAVRAALGFPAAAAIRTGGNAQVDPYKACVGLMRAAAGAGALVFERSPIGAIRRSEKGVVLETAGGRVHADQVVIATGYATPYFKPLLARFRMLNTYVVVTRPVTRAERRRIGLRAVMQWDTGRPYHYARWTPDHQLMLGGGDRRRVPEGERAQAVREAGRSVHEHFLGLYPALAGVPLQYQWEGLFATTPDGLPYIGPHRRYPRHLFALGYGGNGMTFGFLAARLLLDWYRGDRSADHRLFAFTR